MSEKKIVYEDGTAYEKMMAVWSKLLGTKFIEWLNHASGQSWIDIGCVTGAVATQIAKLCNPSKLLNIDPSKAQIEFARNRYMAKPATFQIEDATALSSESSYFDLATMALALFFVPHPFLGVVEMKRVVRPGGMIAAYVWDVPGGGLPHE